MRRSFVGAIWLASSLTLAVQSEEPPPPPRRPDAVKLSAGLASAANSKRLILQYYEEVWNQKNGAFAQRVFASDYQRYDARAGAPPPGPAGQAAIAQRFQAGFPDLELKVDLIAAEGDLVIARWTIVGVHGAVWNGIPATGRAVAFSGVDVFRFSGGMVVELLSQRDDLGLLQQLGVVPDTPQARSIAYDAPEPAKPKP